MSVVRRPSPIQPGELFVATDPSWTDADPDTWRHRLHAIAGRSLSDVVLSGEQSVNAGRIALLGQALGAGIVRGLGTELVYLDGRACVRISPGIGVDAMGEDVVLARDLVVALADVPVAPDAETPADFGVFRQILGRRWYRQRAYILVLQPVTAESAVEVDTCGPDIEALAFEDTTLVDGVRLWRVPVPAEVLDGLAWSDELGLRNQLVSRLLIHERDMPSDQWPTWTRHGLPVALAAAGGFVAPFVDRHSVARSRSRARPLRSGAGRPALWQAHIEAFLDHFTELGPQVALDGGLRRRFPTLPPVGLLPADAMTVRAADELPADTIWPGQFAVRALPVPLEEIDDLVAQRASLAPLDTAAWEAIDVFVPVPQQWFDPGLLVIAQPAAEFVEALFRYRRRVAVLRSQRDGLRDRASRIVTWITGAPRVYPPDIEAIAGDEATVPATPGGVTPVPEETLRVPVSAPEATPAIERFHSALTATGSEARLGQFASRHLPGSSSFDTVADATASLAAIGLNALITTLQQELATANDRLDTLFLRVSADIHRIRQVITGNDAGMRVATSPALTTLAQQVVAKPSIESMARFKHLFTAEKAAEAPAVDDSPDAGPTAAPDSETTAIMLSTEGWQIWQPYTAVDLMDYSALLAGSETLTRFGDVADTSIAADGYEVLDDLRTRPALGGVFATLPELTATPIAVDFGDVELPERLSAPPSVEAYHRAVQSKAQVFGALWRLHDARKLRLDGIGFYGLGDTPRQMEPATSGTPINAATIAEIEARQYDTDSTAVSEPDFYQLGVQALEDAINALRLAEGRMATWATVAGLLAALREDLRDVGEALEVDLAAVAVALDEARHDWRVGRALFDEENARVEAINRRRQTIVDEHVPFLLFARQRVVSTTIDGPQLALERAETPDPVPACLDASARNAPDQLRAMVDLLGDAPVKWFVHLRSQLDRLDRIDALVTTGQHAVMRAAQPPAVLPPALRAPMLADSAFGRRIQNLVTARKQILDASRVAVRGERFDQVSASSWRALRERIEATTAVADVIEARHGRVELSTRAARELDDIYKVAACLHQAFRDVEPATRLRWAEAHSTFDAPVDLRELSVLERWDHLGRLERAEMTLLVDWLFSRVDGSMPEAVSTMNDLVRVALLLAAHAPVHQILVATTPSPQAAEVDRAVYVSVASDRLRIGMHAELYAVAGGSPQARGVVTDITSSGATIKVLSTEGTLAPTITLAHLSEPDLPRALSAEEARLGAAGIR